jgi:thioesterase domain-containing protein
MVFRPLARELAQQGLNCYGLQYRGFDQDEPFDDSIAAMAQSFRLEISAVATDKTAPLFLLGYSMGALLAWETAALLEAEGYRVPLILLDKDSDTPYGDFHPEEAVEPEADLLAVLMQRHLGEEGTALPTPDAQRIRRLLAHNIRLLQGYQPGKTVAADILALEAGSSGRRDKMAGWQAFTSGKLTRSVVMADHFSLLGPDARPELTKQIRAFVRSHEALFSDT